jgi:hypothetical protein
MATLLATRPFNSLGTRNGITNGQELMLFRGREELRDPETGEWLGKRKR